MQDREQCNLRFVLLLGGQNNLLLDDLGNLCAISWLMKVNSSGQFKEPAIIFLRKNNLTFSDMTRSN